MTTVLTPLLPKEERFTTIYAAKSERYRHSTVLVATSELNTPGLSIVTSILADSIGSWGLSSTPVVVLTRILLIIVNTSVWIVRLSRRFRSHLGSLLLALVSTRSISSMRMNTTSHHYGQHFSNAYRDQASSNAVHHHGSDCLRNSTLEMQLHSQFRAIDSLERDCRQTSVYLSAALREEQAMAIALQEAKAENERYRDEAARYEHLWRMEVQQHAETKRQSVTAAATSKHTRSTSLSMVPEAMKRQGLGVGLGMDSIAYRAPLATRPMPQRRESMPLASKRMSGRFKYLTLQTGVDEDTEVLTAPHTA